MHIVRHDIAAIAFTVAAVWFASGAAQAQAPRQPVGPAAAGPYAWIDGSYQAIQLPTFAHTPVRVGSGEPKVGRLGQNTHRPTMTSSAGRSVTITT